MTSETKIRFKDECGGNHKERKSDMQNRMAEVAALFGKQLGEEFEGDRPSQEERK